MWFLGSPDVVTARGQDVVNAVRRWFQCSPNVVQCSRNEGQMVPPHVYYLVTSLKVVNFVFSEG